MNRLITLTQKEKNLISGGSDIDNNMHKECIMVCAGDSICINDETVTTAFLKFSGVFVGATILGMAIGVCAAKTRNKLHKD